VFDSQHGMVTKHRLHSLVTHNVILDGLFYAVPMILKSVVHFLASTVSYHVTCVSLFLKYKMSCFHSSFCSLVSKL
jgi:hypothetical protein